MTRQLGEAVRVGATPDLRNVSFAIVLSIGQLSRRRGENSAAHEHVHIVELLGEVLEHVYHRRYDGILLLNRSDGILFLVFHNWTRDF